MSGECDYCGGTGEICCSSTHYEPCPECVARKERKGMLLRDSVWDKIRDQFTEVEKEQLRRAVTGEVICPRGITIESAQTPAALWKKLVEAMQQSERTAR